MVFLAVYDYLIIESRFFHQTFKQLKVAKLFYDSNRLFTVFGVAYGYLIRLWVEVDNVYKSVERELLGWVERIFRKVVELLTELHSGVLAHAFIQLVFYRLEK